MARAMIAEYHAVTVRLTYDYLPVRYHHLIFFPPLTISVPILLELSYELFFCKVTVTFDL